MQISEIGLLEMATAYIENGKLKKWRYDNVNPYHMNSILNEKMRSHENLTKEEISYILTHDNVVVENEHTITFHRFSGSTHKYR